jgi:hypothetical protein
MLGFRKHSFTRAHWLLQTLRTNLGDLATLKELQMLLLREIIRSEKKIRELKTEVRTTEGATNIAAARRTASLQNRIEGFRQCLYVWRCFGDAIAFLYMDKFALKQCFYSTENTNPKQKAGFILGKEGLANELVVLNSALEHKVPALLVDLTSTIRHGDICLMAESDPCLIEVKTSKNLNRRGRKQKRSLEKLRTFYETDKSEGLRGFPEVRRHLCELPEHTHVDQISKCIAQALKDGYAVCQPERGLYYVVTTRKGAGQEGPGVEALIDSLGLKAAWAFFLNQLASDREWAPYLPFTLTIEDENHLWNFIQGNLFILVLIESDALCQIAIDKGYKAKIDRNDELYPLRIEIPGGDGMSGISAHILARIGVEFVSPEWVVLSSIEGLNQGFESVEAEYAAAPPV